jgi:superfamily II DNA or RNA helicase
MELRPYQIESGSSIKTAFSSGRRRVILCLPTGAGKTVVFSDLASQVASRGKRTMIVVNRKELIKQAYQKCVTYGLDPTIIAPGHYFRENFCYIASVDTLVRRTLPEIDLLIIDEAHIVVFDKILAAYPNTHTVGCTATPLRTAKHPLDRYYQEIICPISISELISMGWLMPAISYGSKQDFSELKMKGDDFDNASLFDAFNKTNLYEGVIDNYNQFTPGTKAMCFNVNVEHSLRMTEEFNRAGILSYHIDGKTPDKERERIIKRFAEGAFPVLNNVGVLTTGFDEPSIQTIILNRATASLPLFLQMCGRGSRPWDDKTHFNIIDQGSNIFRHGFWEDDRVWELSPQRKKKADQAAPIKECQNCHALVHASAKVCKYCQWVFPVKEKELQKAEFTVLERPNMPKHLQGRKWSDMTVSELVEYAGVKGFKSGWIIHQCKQRPDPSGALKELQELKGYKQGWLDMQLETLPGKSAGPTAAELLALQLKAQA